MRKELIVLVIVAMALVGIAGAANYMYEKASVKGVGYKNVETIISTQAGFNGAKLVEKESGSGNVITEMTELEAERQLRPIIPGSTYFGGYNCTFWANGGYTGYIGCPMDYINFTKEAEFEYMPSLTRLASTTRSG